MKLLLGVGYTGSSLRFSTFIFFHSYLITKPKKFFKNIELKTFPNRFTVYGAGRTDFWLQNLTKHHSPVISSYKTNLKTYKKFINSNTMSKTLLDHQLSKQVPKFLKKYQILPKTGQNKGKWGGNVPELHLYCIE